MNGTFDSATNGKPAAWVANTRIYRQWQETRNEIDLHKWYESEKAGHDIGVDRATVDWLIRFGGKKARAGSH